VKSTSDSGGTLARAVASALAGGPEAIAFVPRYLGFMPSNFEASPPVGQAGMPAPPARPLAELITRFALAAGKQRDWPAKHNPITPV
jgi:hypothetical protein